MSDHPVFAGAVVVAPDGRILCQLRDDKPGIICPGCWSCSPGGHVEAGEVPAAAVVRELYEEFEVRVHGLRPLTTITESEGELAGTYHAFTGRLAVPIQNVKCHEGARGLLRSAGGSGIPPASGQPAHPRRVSASVRH